MTKPIWGLDPAILFEFSERRTIGCFACHHSKRKELRGKIRSYCEPIEQGLIKGNYPDEYKHTCKMWTKKTKY